MLEENVSTISYSIWAYMISWFTPTVLFLLLNLMIGTIAFTSTLSNQKQQHKNNQENQQQMLARSPSVLQRLRSINFYNFRFHESLNSKVAADSDTLYNLDHSHQPQTLESQTRFVFDPTHQENPNLETPATTHYIFRQENRQQTPTHYGFERENPTQSVIDHASDGDRKDEAAAVAEEEESDELQSMDEVYSRLKGRQVNRSNSDTKPSAGEMPARLPAKMKKSASTKSAFKHFGGGNEEDVEPRRPATTRERAAPPAVDHEVDAKADDFINRFKQQLKLQRLDSILRYKEMISRGAGR